MTVPVSYEYNFYGYEPNKPLAYFGTAFFGVMCLAIMILNIKFKSWFFMVIPIASAMVHTFCCPRLFFLGGRWFCAETVFYHLTRIVHYFCTLYFTFPHSICNGRLYAY